MNLGEFDIIARYFTRRSTRPDVLLGVGDDAAVLAAPASGRIVVAMDTIVEGVHFPAGTAAADIGYRALAVNLSDLAAMGAQPSWMTLSLSLPTADEAWLEGFSGGLFELAERHDVALIGGDTVHGPLVITVQIGGWVESDRWLTRSGARPGDLLFVSGTPGDAAAGLALIQQGAVPSAAAALLTSRFLRPTPRIELGRRLRTLASAAMDVSDGLLTDLEKLCAASDCGAQLQLETLPQSSALRELFSPKQCRDFTLAGGDDYELLLTASPSQLANVKACGEGLITQIGVMTAIAGVQCLSAGQVVVPHRKGYDHFSAAAASP